MENGDANGQWVRLEQVSTSQLSRDRALARSRSESNGKQFEAKPWNTVH